MFLFFLYCKIKMIGPTVIFKICLEITTFRYFFMRSLLFCDFSLFMFCLQCFDQKQWVFYGVMYLCKEEEESSKSSLHIPLPAVLSLPLCGTRFTQAANQLYSLPILELLFYSSTELGILKIVVLDGRFRALCLDSMSSMICTSGQEIGEFFIGFLVSGE